MQRDASVFEHEEKTILEDKESKSEDNILKSGVCVCVCVCVFLFNVRVRVACKVT